jgi:ribosome-associated translation inhibitor RaiA
MIRGLGMRVTDELRSQISRKLEFALDRFAGRVGEVVVALTDLNGPRGGADLRCRIVADLVHGGRLVVEHVDRDPIVALGRAADRMSRAVSRHLERHRHGQ